MAEKRLCRAFIDSPKVNPLDGNRLTPGKGPYTGYVMLCIENGFSVEYMLEEDFINGLKSKRSRSLVRSPVRSPVRSSVRSPVRSPVRSIPSIPYKSVRSGPSVTNLNNLQSRSVNNTSLNNLQNHISYPQVVGPSVTNLNNLPSRSVNNTRLNNLQNNVVYPRVVGPSVTTTLAPAPSVSIRSETIGREFFDPDPVTTVTQLPGSSIRRTVQGPYGPKGEDVLISGVHNLPGQLVYSTADIPEHEVRSVHNGYETYSVNNAYSGRTLYPQPSYNTKTESVGVETFDPDPVTIVTDIPSTLVRTSVKGPYGPKGETVVTSGVYTSPGKRVYSTADIPEHEVRSVSRSVNSI